MDTVTVGTNRHSNVNVVTGEVTPAFNDYTYKEREAALSKKEEADSRERKKEKDSPYNNFAQLNLRYGKEWRALMKESPIAAQILMLLIEHADKYNAVICSYKVLEEGLGYCRTTIYKAVKVLQDNNFIQIQRSGTANVYLINREVAWKSWGKNFQYAQFAAQVMISKSEQQEKNDVRTTRKSIMQTERNDSE